MKLRDCVGGMTADSHVAARQDHLPPVCSALASIQVE